ncbi:MAG: hypothetical protein M3137_03935 [Actinomycetota bacterium]|nr:hypothetical protein [Actinomycetota bacterium]
MTDDRFKRYQEVGNDFLETARARAEDFLRELAKATDTTQKQAQGQVDDLVAVGRRGTDQMIDIIRREVQSQLGQLGLATRNDLQALERRLGGATAPKTPAKKTPAAKKTSAKKTSAAKTSDKKTSSPTKSAAAKSAAAKSAVKRTPTKGVPVKKASGPVKRAPGTTSPA